MPNDRQSPESDAALAARVSAGEPDCFALLVHRYQPALTRVARSRLGRADWAEDVVQETFLAAFKSCGTYDPQYSFRTWLWTILLNQCRTHYQRRQRSVPVEPWGEQTETAAGAAHGESSDGAPLVELLAKERNEKLESVLTQLTAVQADALRLRFFGGLKFHEIAEAMQCSLNTAKQRVKFGLVRMAELLETSAAPEATRTFDEEP